MARLHLSAAAVNVIDRLRLREVGVLLALLAITAGAWAFIELASEVLEGDTQTFDEWVVRSMRQANDPSLAIGSSTLTEIARDITALGSVSVLALMTLAAAGYLLVRGQYRSMWFTIIATVSGAILSTVLKASFQRERPSIVPHLTETMTSSFPSGHSMLSAMVYLTLGTLLMRLTRNRRAKMYILMIAVTLAVMVGLTRIYLGVHYPTDVMAGWAAGLTWAVLCWLVESYLQRQGKVETEQ